MYVVSTYQQPALVEEFIDGHELNQALFYGRDGIVVLPPGEIVFDEALAANERVVGWKAKWSADSTEGLCTRAANVLSPGGYCRFDVRRRPSGELSILDVNPNPDIGRDTGFRKALAAAHVEFADFLNQLMIAARATAAA